MAYQAEREEVEIKKFIDYKDVAYLKLFTNPHAKMLSKRTGIPAGKQRDNAGHQARPLHGAPSVRLCVTSSTLFLRVRRKGRSRC